MSLEEIGAHMGITRERVRQIQEKALQKLRRRCMPELMEMREMAKELRKRTGQAEHGVIQ